MQSFFFCEQKTAYEMRISDWSSDVCSSDLHLVALQAKAHPVRAFLEDEGNDAHADQVGTVDTLEGFRDHGLDAEKIGTLRSPVARGAIAVFDAGEDDERGAFFPVLHRRVINRHLDRKSTRLNSSH